MKKIYFANYTLTIIYLIFFIITACTQPGDKNPSYFEPRNTSPSWEDTSIYNNVGIWHNEGLAYIQSYLNTIENDSLKVYANDDYWVYENTFVVGFNFLSTIPELSEVGIDTNGLWNLYITLKSVCFDSIETKESLIQLFDSLVTTIQESRFYIECIEVITNIVELENYNDSLLEYLNWVEQQPELTLDQKHFARCVVSVARASRYYWENNGFSTLIKKQDMNKIQGILGWLAAADLIGAGVSVFLDLTDGQPNDPWKIAGRAAVVGLATSITTWIGAKVKG